MPQRKVLQEKESQQSVDLTKNDSEEGTSKEILKVLKSFRNEFRSEILELKKENKKFNEKIIEIDNKIKNVCDNHNVLDNKIDNLNHQINFLQQRDFKNDLLITGLPIITGESLIDTVIQYLNKLHKNFNNTNIEFAYRFKSPVSHQQHQNTCLPVVVRFSNYSVKKEVLSKQKELGPVDQQIEGGSTSNSTIRKTYSQQRLTPCNYQLLQKARDFKQKSDFKFAWVSDSFNIFIQKDESSEAIKIVSLKQLEDFQRTTT